MVTNWVQRRGSDRDVERRTRQIKEIIRLGTALRAEMGLENVLAQIVEGIRTTLGFRVAVLNLIHHDFEFVDVVATAGLNESERQRLIKSPPPVMRLIAVMRPEFCVSHSYFISHEHKYLFEGIEGVTVYSPPPTNPSRAADAWHHDDVLLIPLRSPREDRLLGLLSLDQPEDGKIPSLETIEIVELFASQAALAIDTSQLFTEREQDRLALQRQVESLVSYLARVQHGNLSARIPLHGQTLSPMADSLNAVVGALDTLLNDVRHTSEEVSRNATELGESAAHLAANAQNQAQQIVNVTHSVQSTAANVRGIADVAQDTTTIAREAMDISLAGREAAFQAAEGMIGVRELAIQSVKKMKRLGESAQDIGQIVQMVSDFASQTNLLALNATIAATRAGENGRGFAVVAHEIRTLAHNSAEATKQIQAQIKAIQNETNGVVVTTEHSMQQIVLESELATQAGAALEAVDASTRRIASAIQQMSDTAMEQADAAEMISSAMAGIAQIATQTRDGMIQTGASMEQLVELAHVLLRASNTFTLSGQSETTNPSTRPLDAIELDDLYSDMATTPLPAMGARSGALTPLGSMGSSSRPSEHPSFPPVSGADAPPNEAFAPRPTRKLPPLDLASPDAQG
ncbi:MAG: hypothetical protein OJF49_001589 [Ktedonobacterales bacterium]|jgi:methyl-accepting chemotaxis protein|nr:MAG: hypothetical protein OJF49_001589 [Ktedonobacterales bacterium]